MAVFRIEKTRDYTVMSNYHLRDRSLSLKAKGLLSLMLSLPEDWDYTMKGLARICKDGIDSISGGIRELESHGYLVRARVRNENGQLGSIEYTILEQPKEPAQTPAPIREKPIRENPIQVKPRYRHRERRTEPKYPKGKPPYPGNPGADWKAQRVDCRPVQGAGNRPGTAAAISQPRKSVDEVFERSERKEPEVFAELATAARNR